MISDEEIRQRLASIEEAIPRPVMTPNASWDEFVDFVGNPTETLEDMGIMAGDLQSALGKRLILDVGHSGRDEIETWLEAGEKALDFNGLLPEDAALHAEPGEDEFEDDEDESVGIEVKVTLAIGETGEPIAAGVLEGRGRIMPDGYLRVEEVQIRFDWVAS